EWARLVNLVGFADCLGSNLSWRTFTLKGDGILCFEQGHASDTGARAPTPRFDVRLGQPDECSDLFLCDGHQRERRRASPDGALSAQDCGRVSAQSDFLLPNGRGSLGDLVRPLRRISRSVLNAF